ncbi:MAG: ribonuclease H-like domain-containing protein, partial [Nitrospira sp.]|nr:ribonuclease H-like domain-containing protein [Nitrospira sp.]
KMNSLIKDINLTPQTLKDILSPYKLIITYYGRVFDVPFLNKSISGLNISMPNYDLCFASHKLGIKGGFKKLETHFGINRDEGIKGMDGYDAVKLWRRYRRGDTGALELLVKYNEADTKNLYAIAKTLYEMSIKRYGPPSFAGG